MSKANQMEDMSKEHRDIVRRFEKEYAQETVIVTRGKTGPEYPKRVPVYIDDFFTTMPEDMLRRLIEIGFFKVVGRNPLPPDLGDMSQR